LKRREEHEGRQDLDEKVAEREELAPSRWEDEKQSGWGL
jgi:hypothetical protein